MWAHLLDRPTGNVPARLEGVAVHGEPRKAAGERPATRGAAGHATSKAPGQAGDMMNEVDWFWAWPIKRMTVEEIRRAWPEDDLKRQPMWRDPLEPEPDAADRQG